MQSLPFPPFTFNKAPSFIVFILVYLILFLLFKSHQMLAPVVYSTINFIQFCCLSHFYKSQFYLFSVQPTHSRKSLLAYLHHVTIKTVQILFLLPSRTFVNRINVTNSIVKHTTHYIRNLRHKYFCRLNYIRCTPFSFISFHSM